jgi:twitching motility protein PilJ
MITTTTEAKKHIVGGAVKVVAAFLITVILAALGSFTWIAYLDRNDRLYVGYANEQRLLSQAIAKYALGAAVGEGNLFTKLDESNKRFDQILLILNKGDANAPFIALPASSAALGTSLDQVGRQWEDLRTQTEQIFKAKNGILAVRELISVVSEFIPQLENYSTEVAEILVQKKAKPDQVFIATRQLMLAQRLENNVKRVLAGGGDSAQAAERFAQDADEFGLVLEGMLRGNPDRKIEKVQDASADQKLREIAMLFTTVGDHAKEIIELAPQVLPAQLAASRVTDLSEKLSVSTGELADAYQKQVGRPGVPGTNFVVGPWLVIGLGLTAGILAVALGFLFLSDAKRREALSAEQNQRNQQAILRLLDEMGDLADGDLTVTATVTEDVTGAIADSINYAIEALRSLVTSINSTTERVSGAAESTRSTAMQLADASTHQAEQISTATSAINQMATSINSISKRALDTASVAQNAVRIANKGADTVRRTIQGMDAIREQIQETSKRIKRLGESSQEIGDIVELIDDIADQTNILALNAAMQAAMAGEAGRGFAVVADEVQRLAERSSNATKQIEALVKTIQADTKEAVSSMEQTTAGVVNGARLAEDAGDALQEIEAVSTQIAGLIQEFAKATEDQSQIAVSVNDTMHVILEISTQTTEGSGKTARSIGDLADLAVDLRRSVSGFRLPEM